MTRAVTRSLSVLELLASQEEPLELQEIIARLAMPRATAHRLMQSLTSEGYLIRLKDGRFRVSFRLWGIASAMLSNLGIRDVAIPHMIELASVLQQQVTLAFLEDGEACYTDRIEVIGGRVSPILVNIRAPALTVSTGRALAAYLPPDELAPLLKSVPRVTPFTKTEPQELRDELACVVQRGYATVDREYDVNGSGLALPLFDRSGRAVAAMGVVIWGALSPETLQRVLTPAFAAARRTSAELGFRVTDPMPVA